MIDLQSSSRPGISQKVSRPRLQYQTQLNVALIIESTFRMNFGW